MLKNYYYDLLDSREKSAYNIIKNAITASKADCYITIADNDTAERVYKAVNFDNPEIINCPGVIWGNGRVYSGGVTNIPFEYPHMDVAVFNSKLNETIEKLSSIIFDNDSEYDVCKKLYEYFTQNVKYAYDVYNRYADIKNNSRQLTRFMLDESAAFSAYGAIVDGIAVCQGISKAFMLLCKRFGIQCAVVSAITNDDFHNPHMFNVVEICGERMYIDVTGGLKLDGLDMVRYDGFGLTDRTIAKKYILDYSFDAKNDGLSYFAKSGRRFTDIYSVQTFLASYSIPSSGCEVRCFYDGTGLNDAELGKMFSEIINAGCDEFHVMRNFSVQDGFCNGLIIDSEEG